MAGSVTRGGQQIPVPSATQGVGSVASSGTGLDGKEHPFVVLIDENSPDRKVSPAGDDTLLGGSALFQLYNPAPGAMTLHRYGGSGAINPPVIALQTADTQDPATTAGTGTNTANSLPNGAIIPTNVLRLVDFFCLFVVASGNASASCSVVPRKYVGATPFQITDGTNPFTARWVDAPPQAQSGSLIPLTLPSGGVSRTDAGAAHTYYYRTLAFTVDTGGQPIYLAMPQIQGLTTLATWEGLYVWAALRS